MIFWSLLLVSELAASDAAVKIDIPSGESFEWTEGAEIEEVKFGVDAQLDLSQFQDFKALRIKNLVAKDGARIRILQKNSGSSGVESVDGGDGFNLVLFLDQVEGHVVIESRGGDGGSGRDGRRGRQGLVGGKGRDTPKFLFFYFGKGDQGLSGEEGEGGDDGENGGRGGKGGNVQVYFKDKTSQAKILIDVSSGRGGGGGKPGRGGLGGPGGPGGRGSWRGTEGLMGVNGKNGSPGRPGEPGTSGTATLIQVDNLSYRCLLEAHLLEQGQGELETCLRN